MGSSGSRHGDASGYCRMIRRVLGLRCVVRNGRIRSEEEVVMGRIGGGELLLIALIALLIFGAGRLSDIGKGLGEGIKNFKKGIKDDTAPPDPKQLDVKPDDTGKKV